MIFRKRKEERERERETRDNIRIWRIPIYYLSKCEIFLDKIQFFFCGPDTVHVRACGIHLIHIYRDGSTRYRKLFRRNARNTCARSCLRLSVLWRNVSNSFDKYLFDYLSLNGISLCRENEKQDTLITKDIRNGTVPSLSFPASQISAKSTGHLSVLSKIKLSVDIRQ